MAADQPLSCPVLAHRPPAPHVPMVPLQFGLVLGMAVCLKAQEQARRNRVAESLRKDLVALIVEATEGNWPADVLERQVTCATERIREYEI